MKPRRAGGLAGRIELGLRDPSSRASGEQQNNGKGSVWCAGSRLGAKAGVNLGLRKPACLLPFSGLPLVQSLPGESLSFSLACVLS